MYSAICGQPNHLVRVQMLAEIRHTKYNPRRMPQAKKHIKAFCPKAFTLIELLVVISILALLIATLLPAIKKAKGVARNAQCLASLHQLMIATRAFTAEHDNFLPNATSSRWSYIPETGQEYDPSDSWIVMAQEMLHVQKNVPTSFWCPEASTRQPGDPSWSGFHFGQPSTRNYGMNDWGGGPHLVRFQELVYESTVFMYADTFPSHPYGGTANNAWEHPNHLGGRLGEPVNYADYRHDGNLNMAYADGHSDAPALVIGAGYPLGRPGLAWVNKANRDTAWHFLGYAAWFPP